jgi:hypothetical protein
MGYGEVGGGGSVLWHVVHGGDPGVAAGRDPRPASAENGRFAVWNQRTVDWHVPH